MLNLSPTESSNDFFFFHQFHLLPISEPHSARALKANIPIRKRAVWFAEIFQPCIGDEWKLKNISRKASALIIAVAVNSFFLNHKMKKKINLELSHSRHFMH